MDVIIDYFSAMPSSHRTLLLVGGLTLFWVIESVQPFFERNYNTLKHSLVNIFFTGTTALVNLPLAFIVVATCDWVISQQLGLLQWLPMPSWLFMIIGLLGLDLISAYLIHYIEHHVKWMWRFHAIHHMDRHLDTTSGNRHHPGESIFRFVFTWLAVIIMGAPIWLVLLYQSLSVILTQFNHSNISFPKWLDRILRPFLVTPDMHRVHHHYRMPYSDTNYGNIFSFWDRLFGTYSEVENRNLVFGLDTHMEEGKNDNIIDLLLSPFKPYRPHIEYTDQEKL